MPIPYLPSNANTPAISSGTSVVVANLNRNGFAIQNLGMNTLFVLLGTGASTSVFHLVLKAGTGNDDGTGGVFTMTSGAVYTGPITIAGTSPRYTFLEF